MGRQHRLGGQGGDTRPGIDAPITRGCAASRALAVDFDPEAPGNVRFTEGSHEDLFGQPARACAGVIRRLAPRLRDLQRARARPKLTGKGFVFAAGLRWALRNDMRVINLSLSTGKRDYSVFHRIADEAAFRRVMLVCAINNMPGPSFPAEYSSVFSVASHEDVDDPLAFDYNPAPPAEWGHRASTSRCSGSRARRSSRPGTRSPRRTSPVY